MHHELNLEFFVFHTKWESHTQKKLRGGVRTEKNFKLEKDINCNYIRMPYLEKKHPETIPSVEMKAFVDCIFSLSSN